MRKIKQMYDDNSDRIEAITKGRMSDLRVFVENNDRMKQGYFEMTLFLT